MRWPDFGLVLLGVLLNAAAQLMLKAGAASVGRIEAGLDSMRAVAPALATHPGVIGGLVCYAISVLVWIMALSRVDVSIAYPMLSIGYVVNALLAMWLLGEIVSPMRWLGIGVIIVGVVIVARSGSV